jgi:L-rhamnose mutarotase
MKRVCIMLKVKDSMLAEYKADHKAVWPEMLRALTKTGWHHYSLYMRNDGLLVGYLETPNFEAAVTNMQTEPINATW